MRFSRGLVLGLLFNAGCGATDGAEESFDSDSAPITGGRLVPSDQHGAPDTSAIKIQWSDAFATYICSAVKNASNVYWTAGHCAENWVAGTTTISLTNNLSGNFTGSSSYTRTIASVDVHPSRKNYVSTIGFNVHPDHYDVARFTLNSTTPNIPSYPTTDSAWVASNQEVTYTGYGCDDLDASHSYKKQYEYFDLVSSAALQGIGLRPSYFIHTMADIGDAPQGCDGDSGSPVWKNFGGTWKQIGITIHGGLGYTGFARYSNVRNWLANPAFNDFQIGFQGFLLNHWTGRCITAGVTDTAEWNCDGRDQNFDMQSFRLIASGFTSDTFLLQSGSQSQKCLGVDFNVSPPKVVMQTCSSQGLVNYQRWRFDAVPNQPNYRRLYNPTANLCAAPSDPGSAPSGVNGGTIVLTPCSTVHPTWRYQAWMMTR